MFYVYAVILHPWTSSILLILIIIVCVCQFHGTDWQLLEEESAHVSSGSSNEIILSIFFSFPSLFSLIFTDGVNVDWPGWCFDDVEVMDHLNPADYSLRGEGLLEGISRTLTFWDLHRLPDQEDGECSQV